MKFQLKPLEVNAVRYQKDMGIEDGFSVYETAYPEDGHTFETHDNIDTTRMTIIQAAIATPLWQVVSEGDWIVSFPDGTKQIWSHEKFGERFDKVPVKFSELRPGQYININGEICGKEKAAELLASGNEPIIYTVSDEFIQDALKATSREYREGNGLSEDYSGPDPYAERIVYGVFEAFSLTQSQLEKLESELSRPCEFKGYTKEEIFHLGMLETLKILGMSHCD